ncbi:transposase [Aphanothece hegewaldii CCALA 016]|uniref:Transposase n=1 Tax=Aphanothece hegewaldii CCALA 016 TaxID=2107694 RepID=A0A2T1M1S2_9CHRO|nr:transposase [Aphanothece hegewaldii]PSF38651.1 transposase [Aphanothece hegewaldii CCALA 016]
MAKPILSIIIPTREGFSEHWLNKLLQVKGDVEIILVHPPGFNKPNIEDPRFRQINSPLRGEIIQRITGLINVSGTYLLSINCDEYITPDIVDLALQYFARFPDCWMMRLSRKGFEYDDKMSLDAPWSNPVPINELKICGKSQENTKLYSTNEYLLEVPIVPLDNSFDFKSILRGRIDHHGTHSENFDKRVWQTEIVQETLKDILPLLNLGGPLKYIPFWSLDRLLGLFIQGKFFEKDKIIGYLLPFPEQIRIEDNSPDAKRGFLRLYVFAEILLLRQFPQYGYLWNLIIDQVRDFPLIAFKVLQDKGNQLHSKKLSQQKFSS